MMVRTIELAAKFRARSRAFARRELIAVMAAVSLLTFLMFARRSHGQREAYQSGCVHRLNHIGLAFRLWAADHNGLYPMRYFTGEAGSAPSEVETNLPLYFQALSNQLRVSDVVWCPADGQRHYPTNFTTDFLSGRISYFAGLDAAQAHPATFLCGDRNISAGVGPTRGILNATPSQARWTGEIHGGKGNVVLVNGSVAHFGNRELKKALEATGIPTNRLAMP